MQIRKITIPYSGREKYPSNGTGESVRTMITSYMSGMMGGSSGPGGNVTPGDENRGGNATSFFCFLSKTNGTYSEVDLAQSAITDNIQVMGYKNQDVAQTFVGNISESASTNYAISGLTSGMSVTVSGNGTTAATIMLTVNSTVSGNSGTLSIPIAVNINDNDLDPYQYVWHENTNKCKQMILSFTWAINRTVSGNYVLDLSNQTAGVNCDSAGTLYPNSIATLQCTAETYYNGSEASGITYSAYTDSFYGATGFSINQDSGVLSFNSAGTKFFWSTNYPSLPINIVAKKDGTPIATKTMTVSRNYPGTDGTPAHTRYIVTDYDVVKYNPNTSAFTPTEVVGTVMLQVGDQLPVFDPNTTIYMWYDGNETGKTSRFGQITAHTYDGMSSITFALKNGDGDYYEVEEVPVISEGINGEPGQPGQPGQPGASGASGESAWYLTLSNDNASINCDSNGSIYPGAIRPTCKCKLYHGSTKMTSGVLYEVDYGGATGVTYTPSLGELTLNFGSNFNFNGTTVAITVSASTKDDGSSVYTLRDVKVMTVTKSYDGENGEPGVSYFLQPSFGEVIYNPNTSTPNPNSITCAAYKQVGEDAVVSATNASIWYSLYPRGGGVFTRESAYTGAITINSSMCTGYSRVRFVLHLGSTSGGSVLDIEDVDILMEGLDGESGDGRPGPAIRGPYDYAEHSASTRCWCAGVSGGTCVECEKWIDVVYKDGIYYYCNTTYNGTLASHFPGYWTSGDTFDFIAANLILANNAKIKFITNNALYLMDGTDVTGGAMGGSGLNFWAGGDPSAVYSEDQLPFRVYNDGTIYAEKGIFAGYIQFPYTFVSDLDSVSARYKQWGTTSNTTAYKADGRAYLISDTENTTGAIGSPADFVLPAPSSDWNGFTYQIIVEPSLSRMDGNQQLHVFVSGVTSSSVPDSCTIYCYAFAELRTSNNFYLRGGKYTITCMPKHNNGSVMYRWAITEATGALDAYSTTGTNAETLSTLVATSYDGPDPLYKLTTYTGSTKPSVQNLTQTMFIQK